jgi:uncharacterized protein with GYD domain
MPKYMARANYTAEGAKGLLAEGGTARRAAAAAAAESVGGTIESFFYAFGDTDVYGVADFPDDASATAFSLMVNGTGAVSLSLVPLMSPEEVDAAAQKSPTYRPPGS